MEKILRSLIHEMFPIDLRVRIELLSKRRDISNKEKQEEIIKLLREFNIDDITLLGPGTNRYAFKLKGYVIKVATDNDGKIDNLKEFKMAKRLYPRVIKIHEVSENGTILVAEYIQPFNSYSEMFRHADEIRAILRELSSVYLIGDVGVTSKNYANWGQRIGSEEPVCLDFAYIYDIRSELFLCHKCKNHSILVPNSDFTDLYCPSPDCGAKYKFEDIRRRIGNDIHDHEIGDLGDEGYRLDKSFVLKELDTERSNYLALNKKVKVKEVQEEVVELDNFVMDYPLDFYKEELEMSNAKRLATMMCAESNDVIVVKATVIEEEPNVAFSSGPIVEDMIIPAKIIESSVDDDTELDEQGNPKYDNGEELLPPEEEEYEPGDFDPLTLKEIINGNKKEYNEALEKLQQDIYEDQMGIIQEAETAVETVVAEVVNEEVNNKLSDSFVNNFHQCVSKISNKIAKYLHVVDAYDQVSVDIKEKKMFPEDFYKACQNAVFRSLVFFCDCDTVEKPNDSKKKGTHTEWVLKENYLGTAYEDTLIFLSRIWDNRKINSIEDPVEMLLLYRDIFKDHLGIQNEWKEMFVERLCSKIKIYKQGAEKIADIIGEYWCEEENPFDLKNVDPQLIGRITNELKALAVIKDIPVITARQMNRSAALDSEKHMLPDKTELNELDKEVDLFLHRVITGKEFNESIDETSESATTDTTESIAEEISTIQSPVFSGKVSEYIDQYTNNIDSIILDNSLASSGEEDHDHCDCDHEEESGYIKVEIYKDEGVDIIKVISTDPTGDIAIPIYVDLDSVTEAKLNNDIQKINGQWAWLEAMVPDLMFTTKDPEFWLSLNDLEEEDQLHTAVIEKRSDEYLMGIYFVQGVYLVDEEEEFVTDKETLSKINSVIIENILWSSVSHSHRSRIMAKDSDSCYTDEYVRSYLNLNHEEEDIDDYDMTEAEAAAIAAMTGYIEEVPEETTTEETTPEYDETIESNNTTEMDPRVASMMAEAEGDKTYKPIRKKKK